MVSLERGGRWQVAIENRTDGNDILLLPSIAPAATPGGDNRHPPPSHLQPPCNPIRSRIILAAHPVPIGMDQQLPTTTTRSNKSCRPPESTTDPATVPWTDSTNPPRERARDRRTACGREYLPCTRAPTAMPRGPRRTSVVLSSRR